MKRCLRCNKTYNDDTLNFCLDDGELLVMEQPVPGGFREEPPTMVLDAARVTDPISWAQPRPPAQPPAQWNAAPLAQQQFGGLPAARRPETTLATVGMILGIISLAVSCCYGGIWLGIPAAIVSFIALQKANNQSDNYGGKGMALAGLIMGGVSFLITLLVIIGVIAGNIR